MRAPWSLEAVKSSQPELILRYMGLSSGSMRSRRSSQRVLASPGFVWIDGERYLAYNARTRSHENSRTGMESRYKLVKVKLEYD